MLNKFFQQINPRLVFALSFLFCASGIGYALYSQIIEGTEPCPLCIAQRIVYFIVGVISLIAAIHGPKKIGIYIYSTLTTISALGGVAIATRHVYLQSLPPDQWPMSCGMPLDILFKQLPLSGFIHTILSGTAECAMIDWTVFGLPGPKVSLAGFVLLSLVSIYILIQQRTKK